MVVGSRLRKGLPVAALAVILAGCSGNGSEPVNTVPGVTPSLAWQITQTQDTLVLRLQDRRAYYRLTQATLVGPDGQTVAAREISRHDTDQVGGGGGAFGGVGVGVGGGSRSGVGVGLSFPILGGGRTRDRRETDVTFTVPNNGASLSRWPDDWVVEFSLQDNDGIASSATVPVVARTP